VYLLNAAPDAALGGALNLQFLTGFGTSDGAFDACFSETQPNIVVVACGDGVKVYDVSSVDPGVMHPPIAAPPGHDAEVSSVRWVSGGGGDTFLSSSWDTTVKLWSFGNFAAGPIQTFPGHMKEVYEAQWHPRNPAMFASCSGDGTWRLWDVRTPTPGGVTAVPGHGSDIILSCDWNYYDPNMLATASVDRSVKLWDVRRPDRELTALRGHEAAARRVRFSPHSRTHLMSSGYDFRLCLWDLEKPRFLAARYEHHREFVVGCEWSTAAAGHVMSCSWDGTAFAWQAGQAPTATHQAQGPHMLPPCIPPPRPAGASMIIRR
jgi:peroxin-7